MTTIFEKIIEREIPADIVYESEHVIAFKDIAPKAPVHILIVAKKVVPSLQDLEKKDFNIVSEMLEATQIIAKNFNVEKGYRLVTNVGENAGQTIFHLHFHLLGGCFLDEMC